MNRREVTPSVNSARIRARRNLGVIIAAGVAVSRPRCADRVFQSKLRKQTVANCGVFAIITACGNAHPRFWIRADHKVVTVRSRMLL